eukprot:109120-Prymnesium_polylepis.1
MGFARHTRVGRARAVGRATSDCCRARMKADAGMLPFALARAGGPASDALSCESRDASLLSR